MSQEHLKSILWPEGLPSRVNVWTILDAARDTRIFGAVDRTYQDKCCLYAGDLPWQLQMAAPYLVQLDPEDTFTRYLFEHGWGNAWGVFLRTETSLRNIRHHLRTLLRVRDEQNRRLLFRYYDPRVLRIFLPTCNSGELRTMFGPIDCFLMESDRDSALLQFNFDGNSLITQSYELESAQPVTE